MKDTALAAAKEMIKTMEETLEDLSGKLSCYYRDLDLYDEKRITAEDGETLYHTMKYIFKQLKKAGVRFK